MFSFFLTRIKSLTKLAIISIVPFVFLTPNISQASQPAKCGLRTDIVKKLSNVFSEELHSRGLISEQLIMEIFVSNKGSWSVLFTSPEGKTCVIATGQMWVVSAKKKLGPEA